MQRFPATNGEYLLFLDDLVAQGREEDALQYAPRERSGTVGERGAMIYGRDDQGRFELRSDADGDIWLATQPVSMIDWNGAKAYAAWRSQCDGKAWRLPMEQEFEKAARGVDGRFYPWGDYLDPSWCCMHDSRPGQLLPSVIDTYPVDVSVYGIKGLGGNSRDWCEDIYEANAPGSSMVNVSAATPPEPSAGAFRVHRGGAWYFTAIDCRAASRLKAAASSRNTAVGVRLARCYA